MKIVYLDNILPQDDSRIGKVAHRVHVANYIDPETIVLGPNREPLLIFGRLDYDSNFIWSILKNLKFAKSRRLTRLNNTFANTKAFETTFGFRPMRPVFGNGAGACRFNAVYPREYESLMALGRKLMSSYEHQCPEKFSVQCQTLNKKVRPEWIIPDSIFTQGIINKSNQLAYHYDRGNFSDFWSCMAVFSRGVTGGELVIPSLDIALRTQDQTYVLFDGQSLIHGVSEIRKVRPGGERYSIVYYSIEAMQSCGSQEDEIRKIRKSDLVKHMKAIEK